MNIPYTPTPVIAGSTPAQVTSYVPPCLVAFGGQLYLIAGYGTGYSSNPPGQNWTSLPSESAYPYQFSEFNGALYSIFNEGFNFTKPQSTGIYIRSVIPDWGSNNVISVSINSSCIAGCVAVYSGNSRVLYVATADMNGNIYLSSSSDGITWPPKPTLIYPATAGTTTLVSPFLGLNMLSDNDVIYVAGPINYTNWGTTTDNTSPGILYSSNNGVAWNQLTLPASWSSPGPPAMAIYNGNLYIAFINTTSWSISSPYSVLLASTSTSNITSSALVWNTYDLDTSVQAQFQPSLASFMGGLYMTYTDGDNFVQFLQLF